MVPAGGGKDVSFVSEKCHRQTQGCKEQEHGLRLGLEGATPQPQAPLLPGPVTVNST